MHQIININSYIATGLFFLIFNMLYLPAFYHVTEKLLRQVAVAEVYERRKTLSLRRRQIPGAGIAIRPATKRIALLIISGGLVKFGVLVASFSLNGATQRKSVSFNNMTRFVWTNFSANEGDPFDDFSYVNGTYFTSEDVMAKRNFKGCSISYIAEGRSYTRVYSPILPSNYSRRMVPFAQLNASRELECYQPPASATNEPIFVEMHLPLDVPSVFNPTCDMKSMPPISTRNSTYTLFLRNGSVNFDTFRRINDDYYKNDTGFCTQSDCVILNFEVYPAYAIMIRFAKQNVPSSVLISFLYLRIPVDLARNMNFLSRMAFLTKFHDDPLLPYIHLNSCE